MSGEIIYRDETKGDVEICRELCDRLMQHQAARTSNPLYCGILGAMSFENRLRPAFSMAEEKQLIVAYDAGRPIGYVYTNAEIVTEEKFQERPDWAQKLGEGTLGFYPEWLRLPAKIGDLNNLYVLPAYQGTGVGRELMKRAMLWLRQLKDAENLFVYVADGNPVKGLFEKYGFRYSHDVFGGIIKAYYQ